MNTVIRIEHLSKRYRLGTIGRTALHEDVSRWWARLRGRPDPTLRIDQAGGAASLRDDANHVWALRDVSFEVERGEVLGIIGRNGAGKSTLLKILSRVTAPTIGRVRIRGRMASLLEVGTGFHPELTGCENIYLNGAILGMSRAEVRSKFDAIVEFSDIGTYIDTPVKRYSSGMYVRLAFAVAAHLDPDILVVDEVLAVGDASFQQKCLGRMKEVAGEGRTVLFVSHNMTAVSKLCGRIVYLRDGGKVADGPTEDVLARYLADSAPSRLSESLPYDCAPARIESFTIRDAQGNEKASFTTGEALTLEIGCRLETCEPSLRVGFDVVNMGTQEVVFRTFDDDLQSPSRVAGAWRFRCIIPPHLFLPGHYRIRLQIGIHNQRWLVDGTLFRDVTLVLTDGVNHQYADRRPGVIAPGLPWTVTAS